jgi:hypothetical protein
MMNKNIMCYLPLTFWVSPLQGRLPTLRPAQLPDLGRIIRDSDIIVNFFTLHS